METLAVFNREQWHLSGQNKPATKTRVEMERFIQEKTRLLEMKEWLRLISLFILDRDHQNMAGAFFI